MDPYTETIPKSPAMKGGYIKTSEMAVSAAEDAIAVSERRPKELESLTERTLVAKQALNDALRGIGEGLEQFTPKSDEYIKQLRNFTNCGVLEVKNLMRSFEDLRKFFLSDKHDQEVAKLKEFVELCERLQALKRSGFLDSVADTILRLEVGNEK